jgi:hypothetical protein
MKRARKSAKPKKVAYEVIPRENDPASPSLFGGPMYVLLAELVNAHHDEIQDARIALAWCTSWKPDVDGRVILGKCMKATDLHRELAPFDFVILLQRSFWLHESVTDHQRRALLDHELCHATVKYDATTGEPAVDERGRIVYRTRKHDIEEFAEVVERYGTWKKDIEAFAQALRRSAHQPFHPCVECQRTPGWTTVVVAGTTRLTRCACWLKWSALHSVGEEQTA